MDRRFYSNSMCTVQNVFSLFHCGRGFVFTRMSIGSRMCNLRKTKSQITTTNQSSNTHCTDCTTYSSTSNRYHIAVRQDTVDYSIVVTDVDNNDDDTVYGIKSYSIYCTLASASPCYLSKRRQQITNVQLERQNLFAAYLPEGSAPDRTIILESFFSVTTWAKTGLSTEQWPRSGASDASRYRSERLCSSVCFLQLPGLYYCCC